MSSAPGRQPASRKGHSRSGFTHPAEATGQGVKELTADQFESLLFQLDQDRDRAAAKYGEIHLKLVKFFEWNCCTRPEDLADETLNRIAQKVIAGEIVHDVIGFCWGVAKRVRQEQGKKDRRMVPLTDLPEQAPCLADSGAAVANVQARIDQAERLTCLLRCLRCLPEEDRAIFIEYHRENKNESQSRNMLAVNLGISYGALRVRINRVRERLEKCTRNCVKTNRAGRDSRSPTL